VGNEFRGNTTFEQHSYFAVKSLRAHHDVPNSGISLEVTVCVILIEADLPVRLVIGWCEGPPLGLHPESSRSQDSTPWRTMQ
jgi:hypothetical protein